MLPYYISQNFTSAMLSWLVIAQHRPHTLYLTYGVLKKLRLQKTKAVTSNFILKPGEDRQV
jgi:hypothetical protein